MNRLAASPHRPRLVPKSAQRSFSLGKRFALPHAVQRQSSTRLAPPARSWAFGSAGPEFVVSPSQASQTIGSTQLKKLCLNQRTSSAAR